MYFRKNNTPLYRAIGAIVTVKMQLCDWMVGLNWGGRLCIISRLKFRLADHEHDRYFQSLHPLRRMLRVFSSVLLLGRDHSASTRHGAARTDRADSSIIRRHAWHESSEKALCGVVRNYRRQCWLHDIRSASEHLSGVRCRRCALQSSQKQFWLDTIVNSAR